MATGKGLNQPARRAIETRKREAEILELRYQGFTIVEIAQRYGISAARVSKIYYRALARIAEPIAELERKRALEVTDRALAGLWSMVMPKADTLTTQMDAVIRELEPEARIRVYLTILRWEEYRSNLLGLAIPVKLSKTLDQVKKAGGLSDETAIAVRAVLFGQAIHQPSALAIEATASPTPEPSNAQILDRALK